jgi:hypothetical protein
MSLRENNIEPKYIAELLIQNIIANMDVQLLPLVDPLSTVGSSPFPEIKLLTSLINTQALAIQQPVAAPRVVAQAAAPKPVIKVESNQAPAPKTAPAPAPEAPKPELAKTEAPEKPAAKKPDDKAKPTKVLTPPASTNFSTPEELWQNILNYVNENAPIINKPLSDSEYQLEGNRLTIYANDKFKKGTIEKKLSVISAACPPEIDITISADSLRSDDTMANIAELMGGGQEVNIEE